MKVTSFGLSVLVISMLPLGGSANHHDPVPFHVDREGGPVAPDVTLSTLFHIRDTEGECGQWKLTTLVSDRDARVGQRRMVVGESRSQPPVAVNGTPGRQTLIVAECPDRSGYSLHGPYLWGHMSPQQRELAIRPRRTVRVAVGSRPHRPVRLVSADPLGPGWWPECTMLAGNVAECIGVPLSRTVLAIIGGRRDFRWGIASPDGATIQSIASQAARWGRVVEFMETAPREEDDLRVHVLVEKDPTGDGRRERVRLADDGLARVHAIGPRLVWVEGRAEPTNRLLEIKGRGLATVRIDARRLAAGAPEHPFVVHLRPSPRIEGTIVDTHGVGVSGAVVSMFELVDRDSSTPSRPGQRAQVRRWMAETVADDGGQFALVGPPFGRYEFLAVQHRYGRTAVEREVDGRVLTIRLEPGARVIGRVFQHGLPAEGVRIRTVPDQHVLMQASDPLRVLGPGVVSDRDGRFELSFPPRGSGNVVVGGERHPRVRYRYTNAKALPPLTDLGVIELPDALVLTLRLNESGCHVTGVGPLGSLGMSHVRSRGDGSQLVHQLHAPEAGLWWLEARCRGRGRRLSPTVVRVTPERVPRTVDVRVHPIDSSGP